MKFFKTMLLSLSVLALVSACGAGGGSKGYASSIASVDSVSPGGLWQGIDGNNNLPIDLVVTEAGTFTFTEPNGVVYVGNLTMTKAAFNGTFQAYTTDSTVPFWDGSTHGSGTITGSVQAQGVLTATIYLTTDFGQASTDPMRLTFNALYNVDSALATVAGNYVEDSTGTVFSIDANGVVFSQSALTGCVINGQVSIIDALYDVYKVTSTVANCTGSNAVHNGTTLEGLATLDSSKNPAQLLIAYAGTDEQAKVGAILTLSAD